MFLPPGAGLDGVEEIKRHQFFSTIDWNVSVLRHSPPSLSSLRFHFLSNTSCSCCRSSSAGSSTLPSSQRRADRMTPSTLILSSRQRRPEVSDPTLQSAAQAELKLQNLHDVLLPRLTGGPAQRQRPPAVPRVQLCSHHRGGHDAARPQHYRACMSASPTHFLSSVFAAPFFSLQS